MGIDHSFPLAITFAIAYGVFGLTGFGAAMVAVPVLVQFLPLHVVVPLLLVLDLLTTTLVGLRNWSRVSRRDLALLMPFMLLGVTFGTTALLHVGARWLLIGLGVFVLVMTARSLLQLKAQPRPAAALWALPAGVVGGTFSALFGTGGPIYTMYLARRLPDIDSFRATIAATILVSALARLVAFATGGLLLQSEVLDNAVVAIPFGLIGLAAGSALRRRIAPDSVRLALLILLLASGTAVLYRGLMS